MFFRKIVLRKTAVRIQIVDEAADSSRLAKLVHQVPARSDEIERTDTVSRAESESQFGGAFDGSRITHRRAQTPQ